MAEQTAGGAAERSERDRCAYYPRESWLDARGALPRSWFPWSTLTFWFTAATREIQPIARALAQYCVGVEPPGTCALPTNHSLEFVNSVIRSHGTESPLMTCADATRQAELFMAEFPVLDPNQYVFRTALRGMAAYRLSWCDAHLWAYAEHYAISEIVSEDFEHERMYGTVRIRNPFVKLGLA